MIELDRGRQGQRQCAGGGGGAGWIFIFDAVM